MRGATAPATMDERTVGRRRRALWLERRIDGVGFGTGGNEGYRRKGWGRSGYYSKEVIIISRLDNNERPFYLVLFRANRARNSPVPAEWKRSIDQLEVLSTNGKPSVSRNTPSYSKTRIRGTTPPCAQRRSVHGHSTPNFSMDGG